MRHEALPQSLTVEQLAQWLYENKIDSKTHTEEEPYSDEEIREFEHKSSLASRSIDKLAEIEKKVKDLLKEGVYDEPISITIPPTNGSKILIANRKYADEQIVLGYVSREIELYGIPYNETEKILFFDSEGTVWDDYSEKMSKEQKQQYVGMFKKEDNEITPDTESEDQEADVQEEAPVKASDEQNSETDSVLVSEDINLREEQQGQGNGAF